MLYQVLFTDNTNFSGGENFYHTKWREIPEKPIKQISFVLPDGNLLTLRNYECYNAFVEATQEVYGKNISGKPKLRYYHIRGKRGNKIDSYRITLFQSEGWRFKIGDLTKREFDWEKDDNGKPSHGWTKLFTSDKR